MRITLPSTLLLAALAIAESRQATAQTVTVLGKDNAGSVMTAVAKTLDLSPGWYRVDYVSGCYDDCLGCPSQWRADVTCTFAGTSIPIPTSTGANPPFATATACETVYAGASVVASHAGGTAYFWIFDSVPGNNSNSPIQLQVTRISASCTFRNGNGLNPADYTCTTLPLIGTTWEAAIAVNPDTIVTMLALGLGGPHPGFAFAGGEMLIQPAPAPILLVGGATYSIPLPSGASNAGVLFATQGLRVDNVGGVPTLVMLNAQDLLLGL